MFGASAASEIDRFRANIIVASNSTERAGQLTAETRGFVRVPEDDWHTMRISGQDESSAEFVSAGPCGRCAMVCVDQRSAVRALKEPLRTLSRVRRRDGRTLFGVLFSHVPPSDTDRTVTLQVGDVVTFM